MREAIGSAFIVNLILIFMGVISALLVGSISYSKAYKVKDRIIYVIEKYDGFTDEAKDELNILLGNMGYNLVNGSNTRCEEIYKKKNGDSKKSYNSDNLVWGKTTGTNIYDYCVYKYECNSALDEDEDEETEKTINGSCVATYYGVTAFMHFDIPLIGGFLEFPVSGETSLVYDVIDN